MLVDGESRWLGRLLALGYLPLGLLAVLLTASRGGFLAAVTARSAVASYWFAAIACRAVAGALALMALALRCG